MSKKQSFSEKWKKWLSDKDDYNPLLLAYEYTGEEIVVSEIKKVNSTKWWLYFKFN